MSKNSKTSSSRKSSKSKIDAAVYSNLEDIVNALEIKDDHTRTSNTDTSTRIILELIKVKSIERRCLVRRSSNGVETLLTCLKRHCSQKSVTNILAIFMCLCEHKYRTTLLHQSVLDVLLQTIPYYTKHDSILISYHSLLLKLSSGDKKFPIKARLNGLLPITASLLKHSVNDSSSLSIILSVVRILASNTTNAMALGRHGCIGLFPRLLTAYGTYDNKMLQIILKAYSPLLSKKSNSSKRAVANSIPHLLAFFQRLHHNDTGGRHIALGKSILNVLSRIVIADNCLQSFHKADGLSILFTIAKELNEDSRSSRVLLSSTCNLLKKALPHISLPINAPHNSIPFILDSFHTSLESSTVVHSNGLEEIEPTESPNHVNMITPTFSLNNFTINEDRPSMRKRRNKSEPMLNEVTKNLQTLSISGNTKLEESTFWQPLSSIIHPLSRPISPRPRPISPTPRPLSASASSSWFIGADKGSSKRYSSSNPGNLLIFDKFFPEIVDIVSNTSPVTKRTLSVCHYSKSSPEICTPSPCPVPAVKISKSSSDGKLNFNKDKPTAITAPTPTITPCYHIYIMPGLEQPTKLIMNDYLKTVPSGKENVFDTNSNQTLTVSPLYKRPSKVDRELIFQDVSRFIDPTDLINKPVYDIDDHLVFPSSSSSSSLSFEANKLSDSQLTVPTTGSETELTVRPCIEIPRPSDPPTQSVPPPGSLIFSSLSESCNLRKAIHVRLFEYDLLLNSDINTDHHHQWFLFEVSNMIVDCPYRFNIINCEKPDSQFNYGMQPVLYSSSSRTWSRVGTNIMYYRNNSVYKQPSNDSSTSEGRTRHLRDKTKMNKKRFYTLTFTIAFPYNSDTCYIAYHYPYTYSMLKHDLLLMEKQLSFTLSTKLYYNRQELCHTLSGNVCPLVTITNLSSEEEEDKKYIVLSSRVHPGETNASWIMKGVLEFLTSTDPVAEELRNKFVFKLIPMLNPDGVANGSHRCSLTGQDLNRQWIAPDPVLHPTIFNTKGLIQWLIEHNKKPFLYCDFHGHSRKKNVFLFGCKNSPTIKKLPNILSKMTPLFSLQNCTFNVEKSKEATGRVVVWRLGVNRSYTMETTYCGIDTPSTEGLQVQIEDLIEMGKTFCHGILKLSQKSSDDSILEEEDELAVSNGVPLMEDSSQGDGDSDDEEKLIEGSNTSRSSEGSEYEY